MTDDLVNQAFWELASDFPGKADPQRTQRYRERLERERFEPQDVVEGLKRVIHTREVSTYPPYAVIRGRTMDARSDRLRAERVHELPDDGGTGPYLKDLPQAELDALLAEWRVARKKLFKSLSFEANSPQKSRVKPMDAATLAYIREQRALREAAEGTAAHEAPEAGSGATFDAGGPPRAISADDLPF